MEFLQLKYFCDAAKTENFSKTAKKYAVPPSNISQSIRRLETELGCELFARTANRVTLSPEGRLFFEKAEAALGLLEEGRKSISEQGAGGSVSVCINTNRRIVMQAVERFRQKYPDVAILTRFFCNANEEGFDLVVSQPNEHLKDGVIHRLCEEEIAIALKKDAPFASGISDLSDCSAVPFIASGSAAHHFYMTHALCEKAGFQPNIAIQSDDPFYIRKCVELGLGITLAPTLSWKGLFSDNVVLIPVCGETRSTFLYTKKRPSAVAKEMTALILEEFSREQ